jgi:CRISPR-associated protein Csm1
VNESLFNVTIGALLHDVGKVIYRAGSIDSRAHPISGREFLKQFTDKKEILDAVCYHHAKHLKTADLGKSAVAYIVYCADNVASGIDRREVEGENETQAGFDKNMPLSTVFNLLCDNSGHMDLSALTAEDINFPTKNVKIHESEYNKIVQKLKEGLSATKMEPEYLSSILELLEAYLTYIPSSTAKSEVADISLYDHQKLTAAIASCIYLYLTETERDDFKEILFKNEKSFRDEKAFVMFSCDISGIQQFIYTISSKGALKGLRSRSFYLEMLLEHIVDNMLDKCGLTRANLIYTGGGHAYILLPNTKNCKNNVSEAMISVNSWLLKNFGTALYIAAAYHECSCNDLMNIPYENEPYSEIFRALTAKLSKAKQKRYSADEIKQLNSIQIDSHGRECKICGSVDKLTDNEDICFICNSLKNISSDIISDDKLLITASSMLSYEKYLILPSIVIGDSDNYLYALTANEVKKVLAQNEIQVLKVYGKNKMHTGLKYGTKLWVGSYHYKIDNDIATFEELAEKSQGISRIGVLRADVDSLGAAFISGFVRSNEENKYEQNRYVTISRTATLSRQLSLFFKLHINSILESKVNDPISFSLTPGKEIKERKAVIVYSGGDDMFIVGAWDEIIEVAVDLRRCFEKYTANALNFSAGIGLFTDKYPISRMAQETQSLEDAAKHIDDDKNAISLFGIESYKDEKGDYQVGAQHTYKWDVFTDKVIGEKLTLLQNYFSNTLTEEQSAKGNSFLYKLMEYIKNVQYDKINIARFAYMLSRMEPTGDDVQKKTAYISFSTKMYAWILNSQDRKELLTAINIYVYLKRENIKEE